MARYFRVSLIVLISSVYFCSASGSSDDDGHRAFKIKLHDDRIKNYGPKTNRPVKNMSEPINVKVRMLVDHLIDFDEPKQQITLFCSMKMIWTDVYLAWNESEYGGLSLFELNVDEIWYPDITLLTATKSDYLTMSSRTVFVKPDGEIEWLSPIIMTTTCELDVYLFPFDRQNCTIVIGSFASPNNLIDVDYFFERNVTSSQRFKDNGVWRVKGDSAAKVLMFYSSSAYPFAEIYYGIIFERMSRVYVISIIFPAILLSLSTLLIFVLPPESGEKISLGITNLLAMVVFQELVFRAMPPSGSPALANNICVMVVISCLAIFFETVAQRMYCFGDNKEVPRWLARLLINDSRKYPCRPRSLSSISRSMATSVEVKDGIAPVELHGYDQEVLDDAGYGSNTGRVEIDVQKDASLNSIVGDIDTISVPEVKLSASADDCVSLKNSEIRRRGSHHRESTSSSIRDVLPISREDGERGNAEIWKKISVAFEKKAALFLLFFVFVSVVATILQMVCLLTTD